jgi:diguanylate cyclase (GGDEF)-like protein
MLDPANPAASADWPASPTLIFDTAPRTHPRQIGWAGAVALAMGGSNQCLFLITALFAGQGDIPGQGSATIPLLLAGLLLSYAAAPGWTELVLMSPDKTGGIAAACTKAFRPYGEILSALTGVCYWWGWVPTCGVTAIMSATAIHEWCLPRAPVSAIACGIVLAFTAINLCGVRWAARVAIPIAVASAALAFVSVLAPILSGHVDWRRAVDFHLTTPFPGWFGGLTSMMAGLYLIGFGAPAFEAAVCHVGETIDPRRNVPRAMLISGAMAALYFVALPVTWLGALGPAALGDDLGAILAPTFAPVFGGLAKAAVIGFLMFNMFHGTLQPLAGAARTLAQLSEDGLAPRILSRRLRTDAPWAATGLTAGFAILFLLVGDPLWLIAAANFTYLIGIGMPSVAVWLLRRDAPAAERPYRAPRLTIGLGLAAAIVWGVSAVLGFEQFGLPTVCCGLLMAYSGAGFYALRMLENRRRAGLRGIGHSLHIKLTGAMLLVLALDAAGYMLAVNSLPSHQGEFAVALADIFVAVALLTITVGIVLPGVIAHSARVVSDAARKLAGGTVFEFARAMEALGAGRLEEAHASIDITPVRANSKDELGAMAESFNSLQAGVKEAAMGLDRARQGLSRARAELLDSNAALEVTVEEQHRLARELRAAKEAAVHDALHDGLTGLPNRKFLLDRLRRRLEEGRPDFAAYFIDLDRFKIVNDSLGHVAGDTLLVEVTRRLAAALAPSDRSGDERGGMLARLGGDEFIALMENVSTDEGAMAGAEQLLGALAAPFFIDGVPVYCTASIGVTLGRLGYSDAENVCATPISRCSGPRASENPARSSIGRTCTRWPSHGCISRTICGWR